MEIEYKMLFFSHTGLQTDVANINIYPKNTEISRTTVFNR
jgi:hypothetical protein